MQTWTCCCIWPPYIHQPSIMQMKRNECSGWKKSHCPSAATAHSPGINFLPINEVCEEVPTLDYTSVSLLRLSYFSPLSLSLFSVSKVTSSKQRPLFVLQYRLWVKVNTQKSFVVFCLNATNMREERSCVRDWRSLKDRAQQRHCAAEVPLIRKHVEWLTSETQIIKHINQQRINQRLFL